jgi:hypothetical protein
MSETYTGSGEALVIRNKCNKIVPFTSIYKLTYIKDSLAKLEYNNSFIGVRTLTSVFNPYLIVRLASDGLLNFISVLYLDDETNTYFRNTTITGVYKKCNYSSDELDYYNINATSASDKKTLKEKSGSSEEFHKLLDSNPNLKKKYLQIKDKLGK